MKKKSATTNKFKYSFMINIKICSVGLISRFKQEVTSNNIYYILF